MLKANGHIAVWWFSCVCFCHVCTGVSQWILGGIFFYDDFVRHMCKELRSLLNWLGGQDPQGGRRSREKWVENVGIKKREGEEETRRFRSCWAMETGSKIKEARGKESGKGWCFLFTWKPPSVAGLFSRFARIGWDSAEQRPLSSASNIIYKQALWSVRLLTNNSWRPKVYI